LLGVFVVVVVRVMMLLMTILIIVILAVMLTRWYNKLNPKIKGDISTEKVFVIYMEEDKKAGTNSSPWRGILMLQLQGRGPLYFDRQVRRFGRTTFKI
jgi:uncharacterized membrane protein